MYKNNFKGIICCLVAAMSWGGMFPVMSLALLRVDPFTFTSIRYFFVVILCLVFVVTLEGWHVLNLKGERYILAWIIGSLGLAGFNFLIFFGQKISGSNGALIASVFIATQPMLSVLVNWVVHNKRPAKLTIVFILLSFVGVVLVITNGNLTAIFNNPKEFFADGIMLMGSLSWVIYTNGISLFPEWSPYKYTSITCCLGLISVIAINFILIVFGVIDYPKINDYGTVLPELLYMSIPAGVIAVLTWIVGNKELTPVNGVLFMNLVPITTFIVTVLGGYIPNSSQLLGVACTCFALIFNNLYIRRFTHFAEK